MVILAQAHIAKQVAFFSSSSSRARLWSEVGLAEESRARDCFETTVGVGLLLGILGSFVGFGVTGALLVERLGQGLLLAGDGFAFTAVLRIALISEGLALCQESLEYTFALRRVKALG